jgi:hypothetical protein
MQIIEDSYLKIMKYKLNHLQDLNKEEQNGNLYI